MEKCRTFYPGKDESLEVGQPRARLKKLKMRLEKSGLRQQNHLSFAKMSQNKNIHLLFYCSWGWGEAVGQHPRDSSLLLFSLDVFIQHLPKKEHRDQKISTALLGTIYFCNWSPSPHPNQMVLQSPGERIQCQTKNVSLQLLPQQQRAAWLMKLCQANCFQHDAVSQHSISRTHTSDCGMLMDSPKESVPTTGTPIREASATKILFVASEKQLSVKM